MVGVDSGDGFVSAVPLQTIGASIRGGNTLATAQRTSPSNIFFLESGVLSIPFELEVYLTGNSQTTSLPSPVYFTTSRVGIA